MNFWESSLGEITGDADNAFVKAFRQIPDNTRALAEIISIKQKDNNGFQFLNVEWLLVDGEFQGQTIDQKLKVFGGGAYDANPEKTKFRALNMLKYLYNLFELRPLAGGIPSTTDLNRFTGKQAGIVIRETPPNDQGRVYNWVSEVYPATDFKSKTGVSAMPITNTTISQQGDKYDDIPF